jgi:hypothetical protein
LDFFRGEVEELVDEGIDLALDLFAAGFGGLKTS